MLTQQSISLTLEIKENASKANKSLKTSPLLDLVYRCLKMYCRQKKGIIPTKSKGKHGIHANNMTQETELHQWAAHCENDRDSFLLLILVVNISGLNSSSKWHRIVDWTIKRPIYLLLLLIRDISWTKMVWKLKVKVWKWIFPG